MASSIEQARAAFARQAWRESFAAFRAAAERASLDASDHERLAVCAYLVGADEDCAAAWEAAHRANLEEGSQAEAARCAFWLALCLMFRGQMAQAGGWLGRVERIVVDAKIDCAASGYLKIPELLGALEGGDPEAARDLAVQATELGVRFDDADLRAFGTLGHGQALLALGETTSGTARLDEVMVSVTAGEVGPITSGVVYCAVILECMNLFDLPRASEWTGALGAWCDAQPDLVPYRGQCLVHRSQLQQAAGEWPDAIKSAEAACARLTDPPHPAVGQALYQEAELHRLVGAFPEAEAGYRQASRHGRQPMPGRALLELARGDPAAAAASIGRALQELGNPLERPSLLAAAVDILRGTGDLAGARAAAEELASIAARSSSSEMLRALAHHAQGAVLVAEGDPAAALAQLRDAASSWRTMRMPYEGARTAVLIGVACAALGDRIAADIEFDNADDAFMALGAVPDAQRSDGVAIESTGGRGDGGLSAREREVLALLAAGKTNREIAAALLISQHTAGRHVENIFAKLGVSSRAAATAYAYEHHLL
jgi:ATP/maltotriose-dependent transcriptional regulator MalT